MSKNVSITAFEGEAVDLRKRLRIKEIEKDRARDRFKRVSPFLLILLVVAFFLTIVANGDLAYHGAVNKEVGYDENNRLGCYLTYSMWSHYSAERNIDYDPYPYAYNSLAVNESYAKNAMRRHVFGMCDCGWSGPEDSFAEFNRNLDIDSSEAKESLYPLYERDIIMMRIIMAAVTAVVIAAACIVLFPRSLRRTDSEQLVCTKGTLREVLFGARRALGAARRYATPTVMGWDGAVKYDYILKGRLCVGDSRDGIQVSLTEKDISKAEKMKYEGCTTQMPVLIVREENDLSGKTIRFYPLSLVED